MLLQKINQFLLIAFYTDVLNVLNVLNMLNKTNIFLIIFSCTLLYKNISFQILIFKYVILVFGQVLTRVCSKK